jgi:hypothetical protein
MDIDDSERPGDRISATNATGLFSFSRGLQKHRFGRVKLQIELVLDSNRLRCWRFIWKHRHWQWKGMSLPDENMK